MIHSGIGKQMNFHLYKHVRALKELMNTSIEKCDWFSRKRDFLPCLLLAASILL